MDLTKEIFNAIQGSTSGNPASLCDIIGCVDAQMKLVINYDELIFSLKELFDQNKIGQVGDGFFELKKVQAGEKYSFLGLSKDKFNMAEKLYRKELWKVYKKLKQNEPRRKKWKWE